MIRSLAAVLLMTLVGVVRADPVADPPVEMPPDEMPDELGTLPSGADVFVYPERGQSDKQLDRDRYECHKWAVTQSGFNPSDPSPAPHQPAPPLPLPPAGPETISNMISGAVAGTIIAGPYDGHGGAMIGAVLGGIMGAISESARRREIKQANAYNSSQADADRTRLETLASDYRRALGACLQGRGYTVK